MSEQLYCIYWKATHTPATGKGSGAFPKRQAQKIAAELEADSGGLLRYWIEPAPAEWTAQQIIDREA
jgi:hypothetical protein